MRYQSSTVFSNLWCAPNYQNNSAREKKASSTVHVSKSAIIVPGDHGSCKSIFFCEEILISLHSMYMYSQMFYTFIFKKLFYSIRVSHNILSMPATDKIKPLIKMVQKKNSNEISTLFKLNNTNTGMNSRSFFLLEWIKCF